jgi:beta-lactamase superfamily II metal-dependent hydrolase
MLRALQIVLRAMVLSIFVISIAEAAPATKSGKALQIYFVDVEGGQATLFVTPEGKSLLIDTGWPDFDGRDANRIVAAAKDAGVSKIDFVLATHYHTDHAGGLPQLADRIPIGKLFDHGENREHSNGATEHTWQNYLKTAENKKLERTLVKQGDVIPVPGLNAKVVSADGVVINKPLPGAGQDNTACAATEKRPADTTENGRSVGVLFTFGKLKILDLGDLTWDKELELACPVNKIGAIDIFVVSHHGSSSSNSPALVHGIAPRVAIMDNGGTKGGAPSSWETITKSPGLEDLWQVHTVEEPSLAVRVHTLSSSNNRAVRNVAEPFIANLSGEPDAGNYLKLTGWTDGSFEVFNSRTKATKKYAAR